MDNIYENYGFYLTLTNKNNDDLSEKEKKYLYDFKIPDKCIVDINFKPDYYEIVYTFLQKDKKDIMLFINDYYFNKKKKFVESIEPIIDE